MSDVITHEPRPRRWTREAYHQMAKAGIISPDVRAELVEGHIVEMSPQKSALSTGITLVHDILREVFGPGYIVRGQLPFIIGVYTELEPDMAVVSGTARDYSDAHPTTAELIVEVSDSTVNYDRTTKASLYARADIQDYWILNIVNRQLEVHRRPEPMDDQPFGYGYADIRIFDATEQITPLSMSDQIIAVADMLP